MKAPQNAVVIGTPEEEARRRAVKEAHAILDAGLGRQWKGRSDALASVAAHPAPRRRARQIVAFESRKRIFGAPQIEVAQPAQPKIRYTRRRKQQMAELGLKPETWAPPQVSYIWSARHKDTIASVDQSDVQEIIARAINAGVRDPTAWRMINKLARAVAIELDRADFEERAALILTADWAWSNAPPSRHVAAQTTPGRA